MPATDSVANNWPTTLGFWPLSGHLLLGWPITGQKPPCFSFWPVSGAGGQKPLANNPLTFQVRGVSYWPRVPSGPHSQPPIPLEYGFWPLWPVIGQSTPRSSDSFWPPTRTHRPT